MDLRAAVNVCIIHQNPLCLLLKTYARIKFSFKQPFLRPRVLTMLPPVLTKKDLFNTLSWACIKLNFVNPNIVKNATILDP